MERKIAEILPRSRFSDCFKPVEGNLASETEKQIAGFSAKWEIRAFRKNFKRGLEVGLSKMKAFENAFREVEENTKTWGREYGAGDDVFVGHYWIVGERVVDQSYFPVADKIDPNERQGSILKSWQSGENKLVNGQDGDMWVVISPEGPTGLKDEVDNPINFPNTYIQIAIKDKDQIRLITVRTTLSIHESRKLLIGLVNMFVPSANIKNTGATLYDEVSNIVGSSIFISRQTNTHETFDKLVRLIYSVNKSAYSGKGVDDIFRQFLQVEENLRLSSECQSYVDELKRIFGESLDSIGKKDIEDIVEDKLKETLIKITLAVSGVRTLGVREQLTREDIGFAFQRMQTMSGCAGSGSKNFTILFSLGGYRLGASEEDKWSFGKCSKCTQWGDVCCELCRSCADDYKLKEILGLTTL